MLNIDNLKSMISKKGGVAPTNRFNVIFTPPQQALLNINAQSIISSAISGTFDLKNLINDPRDISLLCESVNLPGRALSTFQNSTGLQVNDFPYTFIDENITMSFIVTNDYYIKLLFDAWLKGVFNEDSYQVGYKSDYSTDIIIQPLNQKDIPVYGVKIEKAYPISISAIELNNSAAGAYSKIQVVFAYDKYKTEGPISSTASALREAIPTSLI